MTTNEQTDRPQLDTSFRKAGKNSFQMHSNYLSTIVASSLPPLPVPLKPPICEDLEDLPAIQRVYEAITYVVLCLEYTVSPKGGLRQWIKLTLSLALLIGVPIAFFLPVFEGLNSIFTNVSNISLSIVMTLENILKSIGLTAAISFSLYAIYRFLMSLVSSKKR
jgi:hypothetical protein